MNRTELQAAGVDLKGLSMQILEEEVLTEENTDKLIEIIFARLDLPWYVPAGIAKKVLDRLLPDVILDGLKSL